jgi:tRNA dimethylallyltransferase
MSSKPLLVVIAGPTASGKTKTAIAIANHFNTEIISADSRQLYKELSIGTAKPTADELSQAKHHFINHISVHQKYDVGTYRTEVLDKLQQLFIANKIVVMCGGTGLYIRAVCNGIDEFPEIDTTTIDHVNSNYEKFGIEWLQNLLKEKDADYYQTVDLKNPYRLIRAANVCIQTGQPYSSFRNKNNLSQFFDVIKIGLQLPREKLYERINLRVDQMLKDGLEDEAKNNFQNKHLQALQTVGYSELFDYFENKITKAEAINFIKQNSRHYAKRQITWFNKEKDLVWMNAENRNEIISEIENKIIEIQNL